MTPLWMCAGRASPNHNTANYALELAGLGAIKHVRKASEIASMCVWPGSGSRLGSGPLTVLLELSATPRGVGPDLGVQQSWF